MYDKNGATDMPPITSKLAGMIKIKKSTSKRDKAMLIDTLTDEYLQTWSHFVPLSLIKKMFDVTYH
ncbi:MAG: hypothetical protein ISS33_00350 [Candidatus Omnitrophica bacterium]|nr:hypothetical protein [Candidatus Omnitrophota bacterium]